MALIDQPYLAQGYGDARRVYRIVVNPSVTCVANDTFVGTGEGFTIQVGNDGAILRGFLIKGGAPSGTAGGAKTVQIAIGTVANADADFTDANDDDVMNGSGDKTAAFVHGDAADDHVDAYFPIDNYGRHLAADTTYYLNFLGKSATAGTTNGTVTAEIVIYAIFDHLG